MFLFLEKLDSAEINSKYTTDILFLGKVGSYANSCLFTHFEVHLFCVLFLTTWWTQAPTVLDADIE